MKIWVDVLTPKQVLFFEPLIQHLGLDHTLLITSRDYREAKELIKSRKINAVLVGRHGGSTLSGKLGAGIDRMEKLHAMMKKFNPDLAISFCSPNCAVVSFALQVKHYVFCNAPHAEKVMRLSLPLADKLFCPRHIPKNKYTVYGIDSDKIYQYNAFDEYLIINGKSVRQKFNFKKPVILLRTVESQASYNLRSFDFTGLIKALHKKYSDHEIVIIPRYYSEVRELKRSLGKTATVMSKVVDSKSILDCCDIFIGSGGTMTTEAVLRGVPSISLNTAPNDDERHLVKSRMLIRKETIPGVLQSVDRLLYNKTDFKSKAEKFMSDWENPHKQLMEMLHNA